ncbi:MAG TPA: response regulator transcription factor [Saprospiraceae bacterium]|nr:response regulator transcription factor [Saprospiraceae bacterium]
MKKIRLLVIEDNRLLRDGILTMLRGHRDIKVVAATGDGANSILKIHKLKPTIILLDLGLRNQNSLHVVELVKKEFPHANVIVMDLAPAQGDVLQFVKAGASGFILKDATVDDFLATIRSVAEGVKVLPPVLNGSLFSQIIEHAIDGGRTNLIKAIRMTKREQEVIRLISNGLTNKEIAKELQIANYTIKSHVHNIMEKLALHTRLEVANYAYTDGNLSKEIAKSISMIHN